jgi:hypothetical protein
MIFRAVNWYAQNRVLPRAFASSLLSLLLTLTLLWGGCISCEQFFMWPGAKTCCQPNGHCKTKDAPARQTSNRDCKQIAFDGQSSAVGLLDLPAITVFKIDVPVRAVRASVPSYRAVVIGLSPPDLQLLHSTFLI